jgi:hypothetical protein
MEIQTYEALEKKIIKKLSKKYNMVSYMRIVKTIIYQSVLETERVLK